MKLASKLVLLWALSLILSSCGGGAEPPVATPRSAVYAASVQTTARSAADYNNLVQRIYVAYFGRAADPGGQAYWSALFLQVGAPTDLAGLVAAYSANPSVKALVDMFGTSKESNDLYPGANAAFIGAIYRNLFSRDGDAAGAAFWTDLLDRGLMTRGIAALALMNYAQSSDITVINNKVAVAALFTSSLKSAEQVNGYSGLDANVLVRAMLSNVIDTTVPAAQQTLIDSTVSGLAGAYVSTSNLTLATGNGHSLVVRADGTLWAWGGNANNQLGDGGSADVRTPKAIGSGYATVAAGFAHSLARKTDNSLWAWGSNLNGQVGNGSVVNVLTPTQVGSGFGALAAGFFHSIALKTDGTLWAWGSNQYGQLGDGSRTDSRVPKLIGSGYVAIAAGNYSTLGLKTDGTLWAWGNNSFGQLGDGSIVDSLLPKQVGSGFASIAARTTHAFGTRTDGSNWAWGEDSNGQLGDLKTSASLVPKLIGSAYAGVEAGASFSLGRKADGTLWSWGLNNVGQLGDASFTNRLPAQSIGSGYAAATAGHRHSLARKVDGSVWAWGDNAFGQLGDGSTAASGVPRQVLASTAQGAGASVSSVGPVTAISGQLVNFVVRGNNLGSGLTVSVADCASMFGAGGTAVNRIFSCIPGSAGVKAGTVFESPGGKVLATFTMTVTQAKLPVIQSYSPSSVFQGQATTFTIVGTDFTAAMMFTLDGCDNALELPGGSSTQRQYACTPSKVGALQILMRDRSGVGLALLPVSVGGATVAKFAVDKASLAFGQQTPGTTSAAQVITVSNPGGATLINLSVITSFPSTFTSASTCAGSLAAGASCTVTVRFAPDLYWVNNTAARSSVISIVSDKGSASVSLSGTVPPLPRPALRISPSTLTFGAQAVGSSSAAQTLTLTNTGDAPLDFTCIDTPRIDKPTDCYVFHTEYLGLPYDYSYTTSCKFNSNLAYPPTDIAPYIIQPQANLAPGASCTVSVVFKPSASGARNGAVVIDSNASNQANATVALSGATSVPVPVFSTYSPSVATLNQSTVFTLTGANFVSGMSFTLDACVGVVELAGGSSTQRQFACTPVNSGTLNGSLKSNGVNLGTFTVTVSGGGGGGGNTSGADYSTSFSIGESSEATFTLTDRNPRHLSTSDTFTLDAVEQVWAFTAAQYSVSIYALDATNAQLFLNGQAFSGYLLCSNQGSTGMCFPTLPAGKYWIGSVPAQTVFSGYSNPVYHEVSTNHVLPKWRGQSNISMTTSGANGYWKSQGFTLGSGDARAFIETEGYAGKFMIMNPSQYSAFAAAYPNGYTNGSYSYTYACGGTSGGADVEIECELKLTGGSTYYLVYINDSGSWAGGAANIEFYVPQ
ncbi:MAG: choice-of-anchor D domain-containing protein [Pseudomonadota bacterium]